ncbi:MAG: sigma-70 family RNA polymerase sigma factor [Polyangiaceae bacterium]
MGTESRGGSSRPPRAEDAEPASVRALPHVFATETALAEGVLAGNPAAARALWDRYAVLVRRLLQRALGRDDVDDEVQDAFLRVHRKLPRLRERSKLRSFVVGVTMRVAREELRRRRVRRWLTLTPTGEVPERSAPPRDDEHAEALARLDAMLDSIDATTRAVFVLRFVEDMPTTEVAEALDCSLATAKRRVKRASELVAARAAADPVLAAFVAAGGDA